MIFNKRNIFLLLSAITLLTACPEGIDPNLDSGHITDSGMIVNDAGDNTQVEQIPEDYVFRSRFDDKSSVKYTGQTIRQLLISDMKSYIGSMTANIDEGSFSPSEGEVKDALDFYFSFDSESAGDIDFLLNLDAEILQSSYNDISSGKNLKEKIAGNDAGGQHRKWDTGFKGTALASNPEALVYEYFDRIDALAQKRLNGETPMSPEGKSISEVFIDQNGLDYRQLLEKFLIVALTFSQGVDDYLDDSEMGKGILSTHSVVKEGGNMSLLESSWDEAFGYFGASINYNKYTDDEIAGKGGRPEFNKGFNDYNLDGKIDLKNEFNFALSVNAAKRDRDSSEETPTDFSKDIFDAFIQGRQLLATEKNELSEAQMNTLKNHRDVIVSGWEKSLAATVVHYLNETLADMDKFGGDEYSFESHATHFSEMKGFALGFQFNPRSPMLATFEEFHNLIADQPVLSSSDIASIEAYKVNLKAAAQLLKSAYGFSEENIKKW